MCPWGHLTPSTEPPETKCWFCKGSIPLCQKKRSAFRAENGAQRVNAGRWNSELSQPYNKGQWGVRRLEFRVCPARLSGCAWTIWLLWVYYSKRLAVKPESSGLVETRHWGRWWGIEQELRVLFMQDVNTCFTQNEFHKGSRQELVSLFQSNTVNLGVAILSVLYSCFYPALHLNIGQDVHSNTFLQIICQCNEPTHRRVINPTVTPSWKSD